MTYVFYNIALNNTELFVLEFLTTLNYFDLAVYYIELLY